MLVIDDDRKLCRLIRDYLQPMGYEVSAAHTGTDGVERALGEDWDAVILDIMLPRLDGFEVLLGRACPAQDERHHCLNRGTGPRESHGGSWAFERSSLEQAKRIHPRI